MQSLVSDFFTPPRNSRLNDGAVVVLSESDTDEFASPVASTSKVTLPIKRAAAVSSERPTVKKLRQPLPSSRIERFRFSPRKQHPAGDISSDQPSDWGRCAQPEDLELHHAFAARFNGPSARRQRVSAQPDPEATVSQLASLSERFARKSASTDGHNPSKAKKKETVPKNTPLEDQILALKAQHPGVMLLWEIGYKFKFYGEDAVNAARVLNVACFWERKFQSAMVSEHKLDIHIRRLLGAGFKVGVVRQMETAALKKAGENKAGPFVRKMTQLFTLATRVEALDHGDPPTSSKTVVCLVEELVGGAGVDEKVRFGLISVQPSTAEVVYDEFEDGFLRSELETRLLHLEPGEIALQSQVSQHTRQLVEHILAQESEGTRGRLEHLSPSHPLPYNKALIDIHGFLTHSVEPIPIFTGGAIDLDGATNADVEERLRNVQNMGKLATIALAAAIEYFAQYGLDPVFKRGILLHFQDRASLKLTATTLQNLEIFLNQTDFTERGSLFWIIDHTRTRMGRRLLRKWLARPLIDAQTINARLDTIEELLNSRSYLVGKLRGLLMGLPDLERGLCRIHYKKATTQELMRVLQAFVRIGEQFAPGEGMNVFRSPEVSAALLCFQPAKVAAEAKLALIDASAAKDGTLDSLYSNPDTYPNMKDCRDALDAISWEFEEELQNAKVILNRPQLEYVTVAQEEYLVEVRLAEARKIVPPNWVRVNSTRAVYRYRSPRMMALLEERDQCQERLDAEAKISYSDFLARVSDSSSAYREAISRISTLDCLFSLVDLANNPGYCRPTFSEVSSLACRGLRHPMIEQLRPDPYVPNDVNFSEEGLRTCCLSGANAGGKSSLARAVALAVIMAQMGCHVAAESFAAGVIDAVFTRMGASDDLQRGKSTFMIELSEASIILKTATRRSLVLFDELGRGTSTHDGLAIAAATLEHVVHKIDPLCIFISHWPFLGRAVAATCQRYHMSFYEEPRLNGIPDVVFLYKLVPGPASSSHGLNVACMARLPAEVLRVARRESEQLRDATETRTQTRQSIKLIEAIHQGETEMSLRLADSLQEGGLHV